MLRYLTETEAVEVLREVHEGVCGDHIGAKSLAYKLIRQGYYWPKLFKDAKEYVKKCVKCQVHASVPRQALEGLTSMLDPVPFVFAMWAIDILGPLERAAGNFLFIIVAD